MLNFDVSLQSPKYAGKETSSAYGYTGLSKVKEVRIPDLAGWSFCVNQFTLRLKEHSCLSNFIEDGIVIVSLPSLK